jgi:hypothetical protein
VAPGADAAEIGELTSRSETVRVLGAGIFSEDGLMAISVQ